MFKSLFAKLTLALLIIFIILSLLTVSVTFFATNLYQQEVMQKLNQAVAEHIVKETELVIGDRVNDKVLRQLFHFLMVLNPSLEIYLLDHEGTILAFSAPPWKVVRMSVDMAPIQAYLHRRNIIPVRGDDPRSYDRSKVFSVYPVNFAEKPDGYLYVILGGEEYDSLVEHIQSSYILTNSLLIIGVGLLILFVTTVLVFKGLTKRLQQLAATVGDFENNPNRIPPLPRRRDGDEIDRLYHAFSTLAHKIHQHIDELQTSDHLRRELVANVSHDLRTPLATLQGYIETLLIKENSLSATQRQNYLQTAIKHCHRLNKLVAELFELARLDARETKANKEAFNLAELVEDIMGKYSLRAQQKNITLDTDYVTTDIFVYADVALIERVLENLLDNAFRFVPGGGQIKIIIESHHEHIQVKVSDNGIGIPPAELPLIFDRFYQLDKTRHVESHNSGLGLAIVKKIIELHNSMIDVSSIPGQETIFSFKLPQNPP